MNRKKVVILGAGLTGLSTAYHLEKLNSGLDYQIFEKEDTPGGLCRSKQVNGFKFDCDGHLLHFKHKYTRQLLRKLLNGNLRKHRRNSSIYAFDVHVRYPFQANLFGLPANVARKCLSGFIQAQNNGKIAGANNSSFKNWIYRTFGKGIAEYFMLPYNQKFWTASLEDLTCEWIDGFIPVPSLEELIEGTVAENRKDYGYNASFWYPAEGGIEELALAFVKRIQKIKTNAQAKRIDLAKKRIIFQDNKEVKYDYLVSTIPLPELAKIMGNTPKEVTEAFQHLRWSSVFNLNLGIDRDKISDKHWVYFPDKKLIFFRIGFPHNFSSALTPPGKSSLYVEAAYPNHNFANKGNLVCRIIEDLKKVGILLPEDKILAKDINDMKYAYVIYDRNYSKATNKIADFLKFHQILPLGRFGSWKYMSMEDVILDGKKAAWMLR